MALMQEQFSCTAPKTNVSIERFRLCGFGGVLFCWALGPILGLIIAYVVGI